MGTRPLRLWRPDCPCGVDFSLPPRGAGADLCAREGFMIDDSAGGGSGPFEFPRKRAAFRAGSSFRGNVPRFPVYFGSNPFDAITTMARKSRTTR